MCNWSIHYKDEWECESVPCPPTGDDVEDALDIEDAFDIEDESSWRPWRDIKPDSNLATSIVNGLQNWEFTTIQDRDLPLASNAITQSIINSPTEPSHKAIAFAIMARNLDALDNLLKVHRTYLSIPFRRDLLEWIACVLW